MGREQRRRERVGMPLEHEMRRALEVAAAGGHNLLMVGPPGAGKSMLAARLPTILPPLSPGELLEVSMIASVAGEIEVRTYIDERFAPLVFIPLEEVEQFYKGEWSEARRKNGLEVRPLSEVREMLRDLLRSEQLADEVDKWTSELRSRASVDVFVYR